LSDALSPEEMQDLADSGDPFFIVALAVQRVLNLHGPAIAADATQQVMDMIPDDQKPERLN